MSFLVNAKTKEKLYLDSESYTIGTFSDSDTKIISADDTQVTIKKEKGIFSLFKGCGKVLINKKHALKKDLEDGDEIIIANETYIFNSRLKPDHVNTQFVQEDKKESFMTPENIILLPELLYLSDRFSQKFSATLDINDLQESIVRAALKYTRGEKGFLILGKDKASHNFSVNSFVNFEDEIKDFELFKVKFIFPLIDSFSENNSINLTQISVPGFEFIRAVIITKIKVRNAVIGYICLINKTDKPRFSEKDKYILEFLAIHASTALDKVQLYEKVKTETEGIRKLQRFLPRKTISKLLVNKADLSMSGNVQNCSILFSDINSFSHTAKGLSPIQTVTLLNDYFTVMTRIIFSFNGSISKFIGDNIIAIFGAPIPTQNNCLEAVLAALEMQRQTKVLKETFKEKFGIDEFEIKIGIASGPVLYGNIGAPQRMEFTALGTNVNLAARLSLLSEKNGIVISGPTYEKVKPLVKAKQIEKIREDGLHEPTGLYEVYDKIESEIFMKADSLFSTDYNIREFVRVNVKSMAFAYKNGVKNQGLIKDVSLGGLCMKIIGDYKVSDDIELSFKLSNDVIFKNIKCKIKYIHLPKKNDNKNENVIIMGVKFVKLTDEQYVQLVNFIDKKCFNL